MNRPARSKRVLGIDPGYDRLGLAVLEESAGKTVHLWSDCIQIGKGSGEARLAEVFAAVSGAVAEYRPNKAAIEGLFFSTNRKTALAVAEARGAVLAALGTLKVPVLEYTPGQIKVAVTGYGSADKKAIETMVSRLISLPKKKRLDDEFDALATALCGLSTWG